MYKVYALWGQPDDPAAFETYYRDTHCPLAAAVPGLRSLVLTRTAEGLGDTPSPHYRIAELTWDSKAAFERCQESPRWDALVADAGIMVERFSVTLDNASGDIVDSPPTG
jgi:uncharacterized protein (TIGR02118 family)